APSLAPRAVPPRTNSVDASFCPAGVLAPLSPTQRLIRDHLAVKTPRSGQLFDRLVQGVTQGKRTPQNWDGMAMFANSHLRAGDGRLTRLYAHFRANLEGICPARADAAAPGVLAAIPGD